MPPHQHSLSPSSSAKASIEHGSYVREMTSTRGGGKGGCPRRNTNAICWRAGHRKGTLPLHLSDSRDQMQSQCKGINKHAGEGKEPPAPQCQRHMSARGPSTQPLPILLSDSRDQTQSRRQGNKKHPGGQGATRAATPRPSVGARARNWPLILLYMPHE